MTDARPRRQAILIPRIGSGPDVPLLLYPGVAANRRGAVVRRLDWIVPDELNRQPKLVGPWVEARVRAAVGSFIANRVGDPPLLIGSSFGTRASTIAADYGLPAIWINPTLTGDSGMVDTLRRTQSPFMLVGGTADPEWDGELARSLTHEVLEVPGADNWLMLPGALADSAIVLGRLSEAVERFLDTVVWPVTAPQL